MSQETFLKSAVRLLLSFFHHFILFLRQDASSRLPVLFHASPPPNIDTCLSPHHQNTVSTTARSCINRLLLAHVKASLTLPAALGCLCIYRPT